MKTKDRILITIIMWVWGGLYGSSLSNSDFVSQAQQALIAKYSTYDLSSMLLCDTQPYYQAINTFFHDHPGGWPIVITYSWKNEEGIGKKVVYVAAQHSDVMTIKILKHLLDHQTFDLGIGEWPTLMNSIYLRKNWELPSNQEHSPYAKKTLLAQFGRLFSDPNKYSESELLSKDLRSKGISTLNGEQSIAQYLEDLKDAGMSVEAILASAKWARQIGHGAGNSGNAKTIQSIRKTTAKVLGYFGIKYNPENTTVSSRTIRRAGPEFKNISIKGSFSYTPQEMKRGFDISMFARDCCIVTRILDALTKFNSIIVVYGGSHWFTEHQVLEKYIGKHMEKLSGNEYVKIHGLS